MGWSWAEKADVFNSLPTNLRFEICLAMFQGALRAIPFFMDHDPFFVVSVALYLVPCFIQENEYIYQERDYAEEVYFVVDGRVSYVFGAKSVVYKNIQPGSYFGEVEIIRKTRR